VDTKAAIVLVDTSELRDALRPEGQPGKAPKCQYSPDPGEAFHDDVMSGVPVRLTMAETPVSMALT
jgi:hypothetical protein